MRRVCCLLLFATLMVAACDKPEPVPLQVGVHAISVVFPPDWEHFDFGDKHQFRNELERISIEDFGFLGRDLDKAVERAMVMAREDGRRETASRDSLRITGRDARVIDTWDHLSHQYRKRYLFVINEKSLLAVYTMQGRFESMERIFNELTASLAFVDSLQQAGLPDGGNQPE